MANSDTPLLLLIDGHSMAFRAYFAFAKAKKGPLCNSQGVPTSVCFGFLNSLIQVVGQERPQAIAIAFDRPEPTFRHESFEGYKANRDETPPEFIIDVKNLQELLTTLNLAIVTKAGYEADDVLGTLAIEGVKQGYRVKIISGDRDLFQLVDDDAGISLLYLSSNPFKSSSNSFQEFDRAAVIEKMKVTPEQIVDYKALCGDKSDNLPGIKGIGDKTAVKLLTEYGTLAGVYNHVEELKGAIQKKIAAGKEDAEKSQFLAQILTDTPLEVNWADLNLSNFAPEQGKPLLQELELKKVIQDLHQLERKLKGDVLVLPDLTPKTSGEDNQQLSLFDAPTPSDRSPLPQPEEPINRDNPAEDGPITPLIVDNPSTLEQLIAILQEQIDRDLPVAWDTETTALSYFDADLVGLGCCWGPAPDQVAYIPTLGEEGKDRLAALRPILENPIYPKTFQNTKFDRLMLRHQGIELAGVVFDPMLASYIINADAPHNLTDLCFRYLDGIVSLSYKELGLKKGETIADLPLTTVANYCGLDAYATYLLTQKLKTVLAAIPDGPHLCDQIEQPLELVLADMEHRGIIVDATYLKTLSVELGQDLDAIETQAYELAGEKFNLNSPKQLGVILFEKLGLDTSKSRKTKTGYSTNHAILEKLRGDHPLIELILENRTLAKLKSTYVDALPELIEPTTGRVHTNFNQTVTATGRLSSSNPNLQNIPIRTEFSRRIRQAFIPKDDWILVAADYSQIELRILTHLCQEPTLLQAYRHQEDVHSVTARLLFDKEDVTGDERRLGKIINFGVIYGMGAQRFAREAGFSPAIGKDFITKYKQTYPLVFDYLEAIKRQTVSQGYVSTIVGRRRYFNFISDSLKSLRGQDPKLIDLDSLNIAYNDIQLLRAAANSAIQGSSADIIKIAMVKLHQLLQPYQARLLLQVHDELVLEMPRSEWEELQPLIKSTMENAIALSIPLVVDINAGPNWMEAK